ncbi:helicase associated domain-containing protein [Streptomyces malaysiensis subsp. malaysiensis]|uniref:helicase associated domain-containing protein n=1 Tax=Streptomyces TaxID=1883 RepID=UPI001E3D40B4|nr:MULTISPECIES: Helicase associated domain protein [Streptomyces]MCD9593845.1 helicase associated domain-containing protein [Streptomyces sp. 8ZJF_21]WHX23951.1 helicase associated domain-containing protein [Streptomyces sp. NA07423]
MEGRLTTPAPPLSGLLPPQDSHTDGGRPGARQIERPRGHSLQAGHACEESLAHAHVYHQQHGHLPSPRKTPGGYPLGRWPASLRTRHTRMPARQAAALSALYPWWNAPWSTLWQHTLHQASDLARPTARSSRLATFPPPATVWANGCTRGAPATPPSTPNSSASSPGSVSTPSREPPPGPDGAATQNGWSTSAIVGAPTAGAGPPPGLAGSRGHRPWRGPPWHLTWQRSHYRARAADGRLLQAENSLNDLDDGAAPPTGCGASAPCMTGPPRAAATPRRHRHHHRDIPHGLGTRTHGPENTSRAPVLEAEDKISQARKATDPATPTGPRRARRATEPKPPRKPRSRLGHRPDLRPGFETALAHARAWHAEHDHLAAPRVAA